MVMTPVSQSLPGNDNKCDLQVRNCSIRKFCAHAGMVVFRLIKLTMSSIGNFSPFLQPDNLRLTVRSASSFCPTTSWQGMYEL